VNERWKLHVARDGATVVELYDLRSDAAETNDVSATHPEVVHRLSEVADAVRRELGDARLDVTGVGTRPIGRVERASTLTTYDPSHPYYAAEYDLPDRG
jgi:arylsulfatase A